MSTRGFVNVAMALIFPALSLTIAAPAHAQFADPCVAEVKSSAPFNISTGGFQQVIPGTPNKKIYVCSLVFTTSSASSGLNINFAGGLPECNPSVTLLGTLYPANNSAVSAGGDNTQFTVPVNGAFCIELGGSTPLQASGWITFVRSN